MNVPEFAGGSASTGAYAAASRAGPWFASLFGWQRSIRWKFITTFALVTCAVAAFVGASIAIHFRTVELASQVEARNIAELVADEVTTRDGFVDGAQAVVAQLSAIRKRDVVVVDAMRKGVADADVDEVGAVFDHDLGGEVGKTIADGKTRTFVETNDHHPYGAYQIVVPARRSGPDDVRIIGAVILEYTGIRDELFAAERGHLLAISMIGLITVVLILSFGLGIARRLTQPLRDLRSGVERITARDYETRLATTSNDEIGQLGRAFNRLAEKLSEGQAELVKHQGLLEQRVADRTLELNRANALLQAEVGQRSWEATHDVLTTLINRREFERLVDVSVNSAQDDGKAHVVAFMDLDQFKVINDTCGHSAGDELLKQVAVLLQTRIRRADTLARLGGDEFGILLEGCSLDAAQRLVTELLGAIADYRFHWDAKVFIVGISIGLAALDGDDLGSEIIGKADTACYWAKEQGRNRVCVYRPGDSDMASRRREIGWIARLNQALHDDRFALYHQSYLSLDAATGGAGHLEVLIRMIDEDGNLVQPGSFIPAAERYNLMPAIDRWVIRKVFSHYAELVAARGGGPLTCAINLSGTSINADGFLDFVRDEAIRHAMPRGSICFEITESVAINNLHNATEFIGECKAMGFLFALDDFGTGTSSFGYLKKLPVDYLKIDGGFVRNLERDPIDKAMTETINHIGHIMGIKTVAEYAENDGIIEALRSMGVDYAQGYGVCRPIPLFDDAVAALVPLLGVAARPVPEAASDPVVRGAGPAPRPPARPGAPDGAPGLSDRVASAC